ncbi:hypothetical protein J7L13_02030 [bacterium]|nr:hypothetical protein [bacterium]
MTSSRGRSYYYEPSPEEERKLEQLRELMINKPEDKPSPEMREWRRKVRAIKAKPNEALLRGFKKSILQWKIGEWPKIEEKLYQLPRKKLEALVRKAGNKYVCPLEKIPSEELVLGLQEGDEEIIRAELKKMEERKRKKIKERECPLS